MFISESQYIGFDVGRGSLRFAKIGKTRHGWDVSALKEISSEENAHLLNKPLKEGIPVSAVHTRDVLFRTCDIQLKKAKDIFAALDFHVEPLLPYPVDKAVIQAQITGQHEHATSLMVVAVRKDHLASHLEHLKKYGVEPEIVTSKAHAFAALSTLMPQTNAPIMIIHEGEDEITTVLIEKGEIVAARAFDNKKDNGPEVQKTVLSLLAAYKTKTIESIYFFGKDQGLKQAFQNASGKTLLSPSSPCLTLTQEELIQYGLAIGCAVAHHKLNFRQKEFAYPHPFRRLKKPLITFFSLAALFTVSLCLFAEASLARQKQTIAQAYTSLLKSEQKTEEQLPQTPGDYLWSLGHIEKEVKERPETFPLLPQVPKVKELLSWFASLPEGEKISIDSLHYQMVKRPDFPNRHEHYKVRVDLELSAPSAQSARLFQESLKQGGSVVDTHEEVQWLPLKGKYKASFYLKDKTRYE